MDLQSHDMTIYNWEELPTRQKIILTTINLIEKEGIHGLTTRTISTAANVNIAAVNYYFGSKEKLIEESLQFALQHMFSDTTDMNIKSGTDREDFLRKMMFYFLEGSTRYPGLIKAILHEPINNKNYEQSTMQQIIGFIMELTAKMEETPCVEKDSSKIDMMQMLSVSLMPALLPDLFSLILGKEFLTDSRMQKRYVKQFFSNHEKKVVLSEEEG